MKERLFIYLFFFYSCQLIQNHSCRTGDRPNAYMYTKLIALVVRFNRTTHYILPFINVNISFLLSIPCSSYHHHHALFFFSFKFNKSVTKKLIDRENDDDERQ
jgi:hypothetical protein